MLVLLWLACSVSSEVVLLCARVFVCVCLSVCAGVNVCVCACMRASVRVAAARLASRAACDSRRQVYCYYFRVLQRYNASMVFAVEVPPDYSESPQPGILPCSSLSLFVRQHYPSHAPVRPCTHRPLPARVCAGGK